MKAKTAAVSVTKPARIVRLNKTPSRAAGAADPSSRARPFLVHALVLRVRKPVR